MLTNTNNLKHYNKFQQFISKYQSNSNHNYFIIIEKKETQILKRIAKINSTFQELTDNTSEQEKDQTLTEKPLKKLDVKASKKYFNGIMYRIPNDFATKKT